MQTSASIFYADAVSGIIVSILIEKENLRSARRERTPATSPRRRMNIILPVATMTRIL